MFGIVLELADNRGPASVNAVEHSSHFGHSTTRFERARRLDEVFVPRFARFLADVTSVASNLNARPEERAKSLTLNDVTLDGMRLVTVQRSDGRERLMVRFVTAEGPLESLFLSQSANGYGSETVLQDIVAPALRIAHRVRAVLSGAISPYPDGKLLGDYKELQRISDEAMRIVQHDD